MTPPLQVLFEDNHLLVINKPAGLATMGVAEGLLSDRRGAAGAGSAAAAVSVCANPGVLGTGNAGGPQPPALHVDGLSQPRWQSAGATRATWRKLL